jgi:hypothetical protein
MERKIIGIIIILLGLVFLEGIISIMFFNINPLRFVRELLVSSKLIEAPLDNNQEAQDSNAALINNSANNRPSSVRTIVVNDELLNNNALNVNIEPVFRRPAIDVKENDLLKMAAAFVERFGTYSNQSNFSNIADLKMFMSEKMKKWADDYIVDMRAGASGNNLYYGVTTRAVNQEMSLLDEDSGEARAIVHTRRQEAAGFTSNTSESFSQDIIVNMIKEGQSWKIDSAYWQ